MDETRETKAQLAAELNDLRRQVAALQAELKATALRNQAEDRQAERVSHWQLSLAQDVTERKPVESPREVTLEALRESEARYRRLVEGAPDIVYTFSNSRGGVYYSPRVEQVLGYSIEHLYAHPFLWNEAIHPDDRGRIAEAIREFEQGIPFNLEYRIQDAQGRWHWLHDRSIGRQVLDNEILIEGLAADVTERRQVEEARWRSEAEFRYIFENSTAGIALVDLAGRYLMVNSAFCQIYGYSAAELLKMDFFQVTHPEDLERSRILMQEVKSGEGNFVRYTKRYIHKDGHTIWAEVSSVLMVATDGQPVNFITHVTDMTERKRAEEALQESEEKLRAIIEQSTDGILLIDERGHIDEWNHALETLTGLSKASVAGKPYWDVQFELTTPERRTPERYEFFKTTVLDALRTGHSPTFGQILENVAITASGEKLYTHQAPFLVKTIEGNRIGSITRNITERKQAEDALRRLNRELRAISNCNQILVRAEDEQTLLNDICHVICDEAGYRMAWVGYAEQDEAKTVRPVAWAGNESGYLATVHISWADSERGRGPTGTAIRSGESVYVQDFLADPKVSLWRASASQHGYRSSIALPLKNESAHVFGALMIYSTQPNAFTADELRLLEELASDLAYGITALRARAERKRAEEQLLRTQKLESLGILAGGVAHDFNNLLVALLGQTSLAAAKLPPDHPAQHHLERAVIAAKRAADLTRQMLTYSGQGAFQMTPLDLNTLIRDNVSFLESSISKSIVLHTELAGTLPFVNADAGQMQQIIMNLVLNAAEAIGDRSGSIRVGTNVIDVIRNDDRWTHYTGQAVTAGCYVQLRIEDTGQGMNAETLGRIFEPFFTTKFTGRGLGLAAVLGIVRGHRGGLWVESEVGHGTIFTVILPATTEMITTPLTAQKTSIQQIVLVIDDEEPVLEAVADMLELDGVSTLSARTGAEGLALFRERHADIGLILLDLSMPELSGRETFDQLLQIDPQACIVLSSGYAQAEATRGFEGRALAGFLQKPYDMGTLLQTVQQHLTRKAGQ